MLTQQQTMQPNMTMTPRIDLRVVMANTILQMSTAELLAKVEQELSENPALELTENITCPHCHQLLVNGKCLFCRDIPPTPAWQDVKYGSYLVDEGVHYEDNLEEDPITRVRAKTSLADYLRPQLHSLAGHEDIPLGEYLIGSLSDEGYLTCSLNEAALQLRVSVPRMEEILKILQSLDPPGVGARDLQECLVIQILLKKEEGEETLSALPLVETCWRELISHSYSKIARKLKTNSSEIKKTLDFIRKNLNPYPGLQFTTGESRIDSDSHEVIRPDVIIKEKEDEFTVEMAEPENWMLHISDDYRRMLREYSDAHRTESIQVRTHIGQFMTRAQLLIRSIAQRRKTMMALTQCLLECQRPFFEKCSPEYLKPLTRAELADRLGVHESTVSRAISGKYIQLPSGETLPFSVIFQGSNRIQEKIRQYVETEDPNKPWTDQDLVSLLKERDGILVARRTVLKYREAQKILSSSQRRVL